jgi:aerobic carbon-monoxide dehydrogenase small subunit
MIKMPITLTINNQSYDLEVEPRMHLADVLREYLALNGTHIGCEHGVCGACTIRMDDLIIRSCLVFAVQANGSKIETIEGASDSGELKDLQEAFRSRNALQCGYCTPAMLLTAQDLLLKNPLPDREMIRDHISGNYCRCTGYQSIIDAIETVAHARQQTGAGQ